MLTSRAYPASPQRIVLSAAYESRVSDIVIPPTFSARLRLSTICPASYISLAGSDWENGHCLRLSSQAYHVSKSPKLTSLSSQILRWLGWLVAYCVGTAQRLRPPRNSGSPAWLSSFPRIPTNYYFQHHQLRLLLTAKLPSVDLLNPYMAVFCHKVEQHRSTCRLFWLFACVGVVVCVFVCACACWRSKMLRYECQD